ncbi:transcriptional regulator [Amycolatopsis thermoflava]|uniref:transcriptional regulator n=1 Tax=Amycolatopsis thermoflava TaxID=84480 RepID=UPI0036644A81
MARLLRGLLAAAILAALVGGLPWALTRFIGWPLPDHVLTWAEIQGVLLGPMTATFLLDVLACISWSVWALFTVDVARCAIEAARDPRTPVAVAAGPLRRLAAALVGAILIAIAGHRLDHSFAASPSVQVATGPQIVETSAVSPIAHDRIPAKSVVVLAPDPVTGVHDSLWRIAQRTLGDGNRWPEIFQLNKGKPQPNGGAFQRPSLIFPGEEFQLPADAAVPLRAEPTPPPAAQAPLTRQVPEPHPSPRDAPPRMDVSGPPAFSWGDELFVGLGLVSAVSAALLIARRRHRRRYRPGSGDRTDLPVAPVVYQLRLAHLRAEEDDTDSARPMVATEDDLGEQDRLLSLGIRDGREVALDLAAARGLGLIGEGAAAATRALVVTALTTAPTMALRTARVIVPTDDAAALLGRSSVQASLPAGLQLARDLEAALDELEAETLARATSPEKGTWPPILLVARTPEQNRRRLQAVLDNGSGFGVTGLLLGQWPAGVTAYVRSDGTVSATNPGIGERLRGSAMFRLGEDHLTDLLALLYQAQPSDETARPTYSTLEIIGTMSDSATPPDDLAHAPQAGAESANAASHGDHDGEHSHAPFRISVLGPVRMWWRPGPETAESETTAAFQPRIRELLVFLAVHPDGVSREALIAALWPASPPEKTTNALNTSLTRLRRALTTATAGALSDVVLAGEGRYRLNPDLVDVDYHHFAAAVSERRAAANQHDRIAAYRRIVDSYTGPLADGLSTEWIETARESIRRDAIDAVAALARTLVEHDPQQTLDLLEIARAFDPHNELIYRDIMRLQERLGQLDAIPRTLTLLTTRLAEIDDRPTPQAIALAERLRRRHDGVEESLDERARERRRAG